MSGLEADCTTPPPGPCPPLPPAFVRLRYFYGKRLGVADFADEQLYHGGKLRFHNMHLHGSGILCGLAVELFDGATVKVTAGAALDSCGHEIVVPYDQCVDIDAWYRRERDARRVDDPAWPDGIVDAASPSLELAVVVRFTECATSPEPAPRDPCACTEASYENGRVREAFELRLMLAAEADALPRSEPFPSDEALRDALGAIGSDRCAEVEAATRRGCPTPEGGEWLRLGTVTAELSPSIDSVASVAVETGGARSLMASALIQKLVCGLVSAAPNGALGDGPSIESAEVVGAPPALRLRLSAAVAPATVADSFALRRFDAGAWSAPAAITVSFADDVADGPRLEIVATDASFLIDTGRYRLTRIDASDAPIVDDDMSALRPVAFSWQFRLRSDGAAWVAETI